MSTWYYEIEPNEDGTNRTVTFDGTDYRTGERYTTDNVCDMVRFIQNLPGNAREDQPDFFESVEREAALPENNCPVSFASDGALQPQLAPNNNPTNTPPSNEGDNPDDQGAPTPDVTGVVGQENTDPIENPPPGEENTRPNNGERDSNNNREEPQEQTNAGDPVDIFNGAFYLNETDLTIPNTIIPMSFTRIYRSGSPYYGPFGWNWDHNFNLYVRELNSGDIALWRNLNERIFTFNGVDFESPRGVFEKLIRLSGQIFEIQAKGGVLMHFERPPGFLDAERIPILWLKDQHGNTLNFTYGADDKLVEVKDDDDRFFQFTYDNCNLLVSVSDHSGRTFKYGHDEQTHQLTCANSPAITDHPNGITRIYHYEQPWSLPQVRHNIVRVEDSEGNIYVENTYGQDPAAFDFAKVTEQLYGGFLYQFKYTQLQYVPANPLFTNIPASRVEVMNPDFGLETYTFNFRGDLLDRRYRLSKDKSFRVVVWKYEFDEQGNRSKTVRPDGSEEINIFDFGNIDPRMRSNLLRKEITAATGFPSPSRIIWRGVYEPNMQQLKEEKDETGATTFYEYDFDSTPLAPNNTGKLIKIIQPDATLPDGTIQKSETIFEYNTKGQLTASILANGTRNELNYGLFGNEKSRLVKQVYDVGGLNIENHFIYDTFGFLSETTDGNGHITKEVFNALELPEKRILPAVNGVSSEHSFHYNSDKKVIALKRPKGALIDGTIVGNYIEDNLKRDILGYPIKVNSGANTSEPRQMNICNDYRGNPVQVEHPDNSKIRYTYDERGLLLSEEVIGVDDQRMSSKKVYDRSGKLMQETNTGGLVTKYKYDGFSRISEVMLPNGTQVKNTWLPNDLLSAQEIIGDDGTGLIRQLSKVSFTYDEKKRNSTKTTKVFTDNPAVANNITTTYFYDELNRKVKEIDHRGGVSEHAYDGLGRVITQKDAMGNQTFLIYDNNGNIIQSTQHHNEPDGSVSILTKSMLYDERNRRIALVEPDADQVNSEYDDRNLLIRQIDHMGIISEMDYNAHNKKIKEVLDVGGHNTTHLWTLDSMFRILAYTDPMGETSHYSYDSLGRGYKTVYPNGFSSTKTYNEQHLVVKEQLTSGAVFEYLYDSANRINTIINTVFPGLQQVETQNYRYDGLDRLIEASKGADIISRSYDSLGRLLSENTLGNTISCSYDDMLGTVDKIWPDGRIEKLKHDLNGVLSDVNQTAVGTLGIPNATIATFETSGANSIGEVSYQGGISISNTFDERKRLTGISFQSPVGMQEQIIYRYNSSDKKQLEVFEGQNPKTSYFEFDNLHRITESKDGFPLAVAPANTQLEHDAIIINAQTAALLAPNSESFNYNLSDARTLYSESAAVPKNYTFNSGHRIQSDGIHIYNHHADGSLQNDGTFNYEVDAQGRIVSIHKGVQMVTEITYDALGRPSIINEVGKPIRSYNYLGGFIEQENDDGVVSKQITIHPVTGIPIAYHTQLGTHYTLFDSRFNLIGLVDTLGHLIESYRYKSFGQPEIFDQTGNSIATSLFNIDPIFGGQRYLSETGLYLSKKRLMNPENGAFLSADPKGYIDSSSLYAYAKQDPINNIDPNGTVAPIIAAFVIGGALLGAGYSFYDAAENPQKYEGWGALRAIPNTFAGAAIAGVSIVGGEAVLATGGAGIFATGTGTATATSLTATQTFVLYGTASATTGGIGRAGFNSLFPEYVDPVTPRSIAIDYASGGGIGVAFRGLGILGSQGGNSLINSSTSGSGGSNTVSAPVALMRRLMFGNKPIPHTVTSSISATANGTTSTMTGAIKIRPGLSADKFAEVLQHEGLHRFLTPLGGGRLNELRRIFRLRGYQNSHLLRYLEEGLAQTVGTGTFRAGFSWISNPNLMSAYNISGRRVAGEGLAYLALIGAGILGMNSLFGDDGNGTDSSGTHPNEKPSSAK